MSSQNIASCNKNNRKSIALSLLLMSASTIVPALGMDTYGDNSSLSSNFIGSSAQSQVQWNQGRNKSDQKQEKGDQNKTQEEKKHKQNQERLEGDYYKKEIKRLKKSLEQLEKYYEEYQKKQDLIQKNNSISPSNVVSNSIEKEIGDYLFKVTCCPESPEVCSYYVEKWTKDKENKVNDFYHSVGAQFELDGDRYETDNEGNLLLNKSILIYNPICNSKNLAFEQGKKEKKPVVNPPKTEPESRAFSSGLTNKHINEAYNIFNQDGFCKRGKDGFEDFVIALKQKLSIAESLAEALAQNVINEMVKPTKIEEKTISKDFSKQKKQEEIEYKQEQTKLNNSLGNQNWEKMESPKSHGRNNLIEKNDYERSKLDILRVFYSLIALFLYTLIFKG